jgi:hypothetical protein
MSAQTNPPCPTCHSSWSPSQPHPHRISQNGQCIPQNTLRSRIFANACMRTVSDCSRLANACIQCIVLGTSDSTCWQSCMHVTCSMPCALSALPMEELRWMEAGWGGTGGLGVNEWRRRVSHVTTPACMCRSHAPMLGPCSEPPMHHLTTAPHPRAAAMGRVACSRWPSGPGPGATSAAKTGFRLARSPPPPFRSPADSTLSLFFPTPDS